MDLQPSRHRRGTSQSMGLPISVTDKAGIASQAYATIIASPHTYGTTWFIQLDHIAPHYGHRFFWQQLSGSCLLPRMYVPLYRLPACCLLPCCALPAYRSFCMCTSYALHVDIPFSTFPL